VTGICTASIIYGRGPFCPYRFSLSPSCVTRSSHWASREEARTSWASHTKRDRISFYDCLSIFYDWLHEVHRPHAHKNYITLTCHWCFFYFMLCQCGLYTNLLEHQWPYVREPMLLWISPGFSTFRVCVLCVMKMSERRRQLVTLADNSLEDLPASQLCREITCLNFISITKCKVHQKRGWESSSFVSTACTSCTWEVSVVVYKRYFETLFLVKLSIFYLTEDWFCVLLLLFFIFYNKIFNLTTIFCIW
jgi:hypothetical protein